MNLWTEWNIQRTCRVLNWSFLIVGLTGIWFQTENWLAVLFGFIASIHVTQSFSKGQEK